MIDESRGFSLWVDFIERDFIKTKFKKMLEKEIVDGATSNPSIFANAILNSPAYKKQLKSLEDKSAKEKYEALAMQDIKEAAIALRPYYEQALEGYVSIEVDPFLSNDAKATIDEGIRLFKTIDEPNVMIKVPATYAGYEAMQELMARGISVNATLVFSPIQAQEALNAMKKGVSRFTSEFDEGRVEGVISIFVSRFDRKLDKKLKSLGIPPSKTGIFNAAKIYNLIEQNSHPAIKTLFASTGVKEEQNLPKDYYITKLYAKNSINTAPLETIEAFGANSNKGELALPICSEVIDDYFKRLEQNEILMQPVYEELMQEGLKAFEEAFAKILKNLE